MFENQQIMICEQLLLLTIILTAESSLKSGRWFSRRTITRVVYEKQLSTACVELEPSIKPCKYVRQLQIDPTSSFKIRKTTVPELLDHNGPPLTKYILSGSEEEIFDRKEKVSWSSYFGLEDITITQTRTEETLSRLHHQVQPVTFSIRGCQPSRLPFDLSLCLNKTALSDTSIKC